MLKIAYQYGYEMALEETGMTKEALLGRVLLNTAKYLGKAGLGAGKALFHSGKSLYKGVGRLVPGGTGTLSYGLLGGGLNALTADPGHRLEAFGKGFGTGVLGGIGWHYGGKLTSGAFRRLAGSKFLLNKTPGLSKNLFKVVGEAGKPGISFGEILSGQHISPAQAAKLFGLKALTSGAGLGAAFWANSATEEMAKEHIPFLRTELPDSYKNIPRYVNVARDVLRAPRIGLTPPGGSPGAFPGTVQGSQTW